MRAEGGFQAIKKTCEEMGNNVAEHIQVYGKGNEKRLTGQHETCSINEFKWGIADRGASIRVGRDTFKAGRGYLEDRRPAANADPYLVTGVIMKTARKALTGGKTLDV